MAGTIKDIPIVTGSPSEFRVMVDRKSSPAETSTGMAEASLFVGPQGPQGPTGPKGEIGGQPLWSTDTITVPTTNATFWAADANSVSNVNYTLPLTSGGAQVVEVSSDELSTNGDYERVELRYNKPDDVWEKVSILKSNIGVKGWAPDFIYEYYGNRLIKKLSGYSGGVGTAPTSAIGSYLTASGAFTSNKSLAKDFTKEVPQTFTSSIADFNSLVENINIHLPQPLPPGQKLEIHYFGLNSFFGSFMIQLRLYPSYDWPSNFWISSVPLSGSKVELISKDGQLGRINARVFIQFKDFGSFPSTSFLTPGLGQYFNLLKDFYKTEPFIRDNTFKILNDSAGATFLAQYVEDIFISPETLPGKNKGFKITYIAGNHSVFGKMLLQIANWDRATGVVAEGSNYVLYDRPISGKILEFKKLDGTINARLFVKFTDFGTTGPDFPTADTTLVDITNDVIILDKAFKSSEAYILDTNSKENSIVEVDVESSSGNAIQNAVNATYGGFAPGGSVKRYLFNIAPGLYSISNSSQYYYDGTWRSMIAPKDNMHFLGANAEDCIIEASLPYNDGDINTSSPRDAHQVLMNWSDNVIFENLTFRAINLRYAIHQDDAREANGKRYYKNCVFEFIGDKGVRRALGIGTYSGSETYVTGGKSVSNIELPLAIHNNVAFSKKSIWSFESHEFISHADYRFAAVQNSGSLAGCNLIFKGCSFGSSLAMVYVDWWIYSPGVNDHFNHADWRVVGFGNAPFAFINQVIGSSLAVRSLSTGNSSVVRFVTSSTAYPLLIQNPRNVYGSLGSPERKIQDKYVVWDGSSGLPGHAIGAKSIREQNYSFGTTTSQDRMGLRLGDCSSINKTLGIVIDGTTYDVVFNKNYTSFTNAQVLTEINTVIGGAGVAYEHNIGREYYAELTDCMTIATNFSTTIPILKGAVVTKFGDRISLAQTGDPVFGVALDDIPAYSMVQGVVKGRGRIMTKNYISVLNTDAHFVKADSDCVKGDKYRVLNGELIKDNVNGTILAISGSTVAINC